MTLPPSAPPPSRVAQAVRGAGGWLRNKVAAATNAARAKASQLADTVQRKVYDAATGVKPETVDRLSERYAGATRAYQNAKAAVNDKIERVKRIFGADPPQACVSNCPAAGPQDGGLMVPTDQCPADAIPIAEGGVPAAIAKAKAATVSSESRCCAAQPPSVRNRTIYYVNGVNTTPAGHCDTLRKLRDMTCGRVIGVLNATEGLATDATRTGDARQMIKDEIGAGLPRTYPGFTPAVQTMKEIMVDEAMNGGQPQIFAHSEGGAITSLAAIRAKAMLKSGGRGDAMSNLEITSMGAAAPAWPDGPRYTHYVHVSDVIPDKLGLGNPNARPGKDARVIRFDGYGNQFQTEAGTPLPQFKGWQPGSDPLAEHYADSSYLPYINGAGQGCLGQP